MSTIDRPNATQVAQLESGDFLNEPAVRSTLAKAAQDNAQARRAMFERITAQLRGSADQAAFDADAARALGHCRT
jgi:hypothetical protein